METEVNISLPVLFITPCVYCVNIFQPIYFQYVNVIPNILCPWILLDQLWMMLIEDKLTKLSLTSAEFCNI